MPWQRLNPPWDRLGVSLIPKPHYELGGFRVGRTGGLRRRLQMEIGGCYTWWSACILVQKPSGRGATNTLLWYILFPRTRCWTSEVAVLDGPLVQPHVTALISFVLHEFQPLLIHCIVATAVTGLGTTEGKPTSPSQPHCEVVPAHVLHEAGRWDNCAWSLCSPCHVYPSLLSWEGYRYNLCQVTNCLGHLKFWWKMKTTMGIYKLVLWVIVATVSHLYSPEVPARPIPEWAHRCPKAPQLAVQKKYS